jgi:pyruvate kinase
MTDKVIIQKFKPLDAPKTAIIATIGGPDVYSQHYISNLIKEGMTIARLNLAHINDYNNRESEDYKHVLRVINDIEDISRTKKRPIGIMLDVGGPKIRVGNLKQPIRIHPGDHITFTAKPGYDTIDKCSVTYSGFVDDIESGHRIFLDDGKIELKMLEKDTKKSEALCEIVTASEKYIRKNKGFNLPDTSIREASLTKKDIRILETIAHYHMAKYIDFTALSFIREAEDLKPFRDLLGNYYVDWQHDTGEQKGPVIISKIETSQAVQPDKNGEYTELDKIVSGSGGIMVARGDLAVETSPEDVPLIQKYLTKTGIEQGKPVIVATQMLLSMTEREHKRPTRPEANDVATAVFDYVDAVMLSEETATGKNPALCVNTMSNIALKAEKSQKNEREFLKYTRLLNPEKQTPGVEDSVNRQQAVAESAILLANDLKSPAIVVGTATGSTAMKISRYRPIQPIIAITNNEKSARKMLLYRGIYPFLVKNNPDSLEKIVHTARVILQTVTLNGKKLIEPVKGQKICVPLTLGIEPEREFSSARAGNTNTIYILEFE